jgi:hypothetical protein
VESGGAVLTAHSNQAFVCVPTQTALVPLTPPVDAKVTVSARKISPRLLALCWLAFFIVLTRTFDLNRLLILIVAASEQEVFVGYSDGALRVWSQVASERARFIFVLFLYKFLRFRLHLTT